MMARKDIHGEFTFKKGAGWRGGVSPKFTWKESIWTQKNLRRWSTFGVSRHSKVGAFISFLFSMPPYGRCGPMNKVTLLRTFICVCIKVPTGRAASRLFSLWFLFLILQLPSSCCFCFPLCLQLTVGRVKISLYVHWTSTGMRDLWLYRLQLMLLLYK